MKLVARLATLVLLIIGGLNANGQAKQPSSSEILLKMNKLNVLGTALYFAAHPDDENTRLIGYLSRGELVYTGYLGLTRGDVGYGRKQRKNLFQNVGW